MTLTNTFINNNIAVLTILLTNIIKASELDLKSNSSEFCQLIASLLKILFGLKLKNLILRSRSLTFSERKKDMNTDKLAIN